MRQSIMDKDINRIKVVLAEKGGAARLPSVSWREPEDQQVAGRAVRLCPHDCFQVVYQCVPATDGDISENSKIAGC